MSFARGRFGIEYNTASRDDDSKGLLPAALAAVFLVALASLVWTIVSHYVRKGGAGDGESAAAETVLQQSEAPPAGPPVEMPSPEPLPLNGDGKRPAVVNNLLLRIEEARNKRDLAMEASTIEQLRSLPGSPAADLDNSLAKRLGYLNVSKLFGGRPSSWTTEVVVKRGDNAVRIAREHGSTLESLKRLNGGDVDRLKVGQRLTVMDHPRFSLAVRRRQRTADLSLNGKFFKRYYLVADVTAGNGAYEVADGVRRLFQEKGVVLAEADRKELEALLPRGTPVLIAEF